VAADWRSAPLSPADRALAEHAARLTHEPAAMRQADVEALRRHGFDDRAIHDAVQVAAYFNYINRVADALGIEPEDFVLEWERPPAD
jgi:uncharacterized peroxidase-related enzyme